jgi:sirohydrochlorin cobaltochelatase
MTASTGLILFAHGARDPRWAVPFEAVAARLQGSRPDVPVRLAFLEFMAPTLSEAGAQLVAQGCTAVEVLPMFLGAGGHVRKDLPLLMDALRTAHPDARFTLHAAIGEIDSVVAAMAKAALDLIAPAASAPRTAA